MCPRSVGAIVYFSTSASSLQNNNTEQLDHGEMREGAVV